MSRKILTVLLLVFTGMAFAGELEDIIEKHYEALGGKSVLASSNSIKSTGKIIFNTPQGEMEMTTTGVMKGGDKMRSDTVMQGMTIVQCLNGDTGWQIMPMMGSNDPQDLAGDELKNLQSRADFRGDLWDWKEKGYKLELMGKEDVEGTEAYKIQVTTEDGDVRFHFLDTEYYLPIKTVGKFVQMGQEIELTSFPSDYKKLSNGLMMAHSASMTTQMGEMVFKMESVEVNVDVPDSTFEKPVKKEEPKKEGQ